jgi:hypothetical protein
MESKDIVNAYLKANSELQTVKEKQQKLMESRESAISCIDTEMNQEIQKVRQKHEGNKKGVRNAINPQIEELEIAKNKHNERRIQMEQVVEMVSKLSTQIEKIAPDNIGYYTRKDRIYDYVPVLHYSIIHEEEAINLYAVVIENEKQKLNKSLWIIGSAVFVKKTHGYPDIKTLNNKERPDIYIHIKDARTVDELVQYTKKFLVNLINLNPKKQALIDLKSLIIANQAYYQEMLKYKGMKVSDFLPILQTYCASCGYYSFEGIHALDGNCIHCKQPLVKNEKLFRPGGL